MVCAPEGFSLPRLRCYNFGMRKTNPKVIRRSIMEILYDSYQVDPLHMLSPYDLAEFKTVILTDLTPNCHYLHDRNLIEMMVGYNPPMFDAVRIAPKGIELYEDVRAFDREFPPFATEGRGAPNVVPLIMQMGREAEICSLEGVRREWLMKDLSHLRDELRLPEEEWRADIILRDLQWLEGFFEEDLEAELPALVKLKDMLTAWLS